MNFLNNDFRKLRAGDSMNAKRLIKSGFELFALKNCFKAELFPISVLINKKKEVILVVFLNRPKQ